MSIPGIADGVTTRAVRAVINQLMGFKALANRRVVKTWSVWSGKESDAQQPSLDMMPWCRLTALGQPAQRVARRPGPGRTATMTPIRLTIELAVPGTDQSDLMNLWDVFHEALFPTDDAEFAGLQARLAAAGVRDVHLTQPALPQAAGDLDATSIRGAGEVTLTVFRYT